VILRRHHPPRLRSLRRQHWITWLQITTAFLWSLFPPFYTLSRTGEADAEGALESLFPPFYTLSRTALLASLTLATLTLSAASTPTQNAH
jgi:hypothetical protein